MGVIWWEQHGDSGGGDFSRDSVYTDFVGVSPDQGCFYCRQSIEFPCVVWMGHEHTIFLHPDCIAPLAERLFRDLHEVHCPGAYPKNRRQEVENAIEE